MPACLEQDEDDATYTHTESDEYFVDGLTHDFPDAEIARFLSKLHALHARYKKVYVEIKPPEDDHEVNAGNLVEFREADYVSVTLYGTDAPARKRNTRRQKD